MKTTLYPACSFGKCFTWLVITLMILSLPSFLYSQERPNIVWIVCEDISPFIGSYGDATVNTPNIDALAAEGVRYTRVYTTAGVCAPSRSSIITGMNQISIGTQHMRTLTDASHLPGGVPPYSAILPSYVKAFPEYLRKMGYYTSNNAKEDYQFQEPVTVWDESSIGASYRNRAPEQPFFSVFNLAISHESQIISPPDSLYYEPDQMILPMFYENTPQMRHDKAAMYTRIEQMDMDLGEIIAQLREDGVYDDSYVVFYSDHGGSLPWMKREVLERGTHIPLIIKHPKGKNAGTVNNDLISSIDFAPSMLSIALMEIPKYFQGKAFLGPEVESKKNKYVFAARDRMDTQYDRVRSVSDGKFRYVYNFHPELPKHQNLAYRNQIASMREILDMRDSGLITNPYLLDWFATPKPVEELYYTSKDPDEVHNLAGKESYQGKKEELKAVLFDWMDKIGDKSTVPERDMVVENWWSGEQEPPLTKPPKIIRYKNGVGIVCGTEGASIGFRIFDHGNMDSTITRTIKTWDFHALFSQSEETTIEVPKPWQIHIGDTIPLEKGQTLQVNAKRIGYRANEIIFEN